MNEYLKTKSETQKAIQIYKTEKDLVMEILAGYSDLYAERQQSIYTYFESLMEAKKPAVSIEIYNPPIDRVEEFRTKLSKFFFIYGDYRQLRDHSSYHLSVSKIKSVARCLDALERDGFDNNAGLVGLLMGFPLNEISDYINRSKEDEYFKRKEWLE